MEIVNILRHGVTFGDECEVGILGRSYNVNLAEQTGFFDCVGGPGSGLKICGLTVQKIVGHHAELHARASAKEQNGVTFRYLKQFFDQSGGLVHNCLKLFAAVGDFKYRQSCVCEIEDCICGVLDCVLAQYRRAGIKVVLLHYLYFLKAFVIRHTKLRKFFSNPNIPVANLPNSDAERGGRS